MKEKPKFKCDFCLEMEEKVITPKGKKTPVICYDCARAAKELINSDKSA